MTNTKCASCGHRGIDVVKVTSKLGVNFDVALVQCGSCGIVVTAFPNVNLALQVEELKQELHGIADEVSRLRQTIAGKPR